MNDAAPTDRTGGDVAPRGLSAMRRWLGPFLTVPTPVIFVVAALLACLLLWRQGALSNVAVALRDVSVGQAFAILLGYGASILVLALRWHALVRMAGATAAWTASAEVFLTSVIVNYAAPIGLAVPTRAALTMRDLGLRPGLSAAVAGWEAALDITALSTISFIWLLFGGATLVQSLVVDERIVLAVLIALGVIVVAAIAILRSKPVGGQYGRSILRMLSLPACSPGLGLLVLALTAAYWLTQIGVMAALMSLFGTFVTMPLLLGVMGLPVLIGMLSPVPGGAGVREALMAGAARLEGVTAGPVLLAAIAYRLALFVVTPVVWGAVRLARAWANRR